MKVSMISCWILAFAGCAAGMDGESPDDGVEARVAASDAPALRTETDLECDRGRSEIVVRRGVREIGTPPLNADRPELSPDGRRLVYSVEEPTALPFFILSAYLVTSRDGRRWSEPRLLEQGIGAVVSGTIKSWFFPTFRPDTDGLLIGLGTLETDESGIPDLATLDASFVHVNESGETLDTVLSALDVGLPFGEIPEGQRYSPDGRWVVFFAQQSPAVQGLYLYNVATRALTRMTAELDRDPQFSADGSTIYFHTLHAGDPQAGVPETDTLGELSLQFSGDEVSATRRILEPKPGLHRYEQHPTSIVGSDVLWFHARNAADAPDALAARRTCARGRFQLTVHVRGRRIVDAQRPSSALYTRDVTFMGKFEGDTNYRIFAIDDEVVDRLTDIIESVPCHRGDR
jgi:hypothetical protein